MRKADRESIVVLLVIAVAAVVLFPLLSGSSGSDDATVASDYVKRQGRTYQSKSGKAITVAPCPFDPNTADSALLLRQGLRPWQIRLINKYRAKGGRFRTKEDFAQLYGLTLRQYRQLEPYVRIAPEVMASDVVKRKPYSHDGGSSFKKSDEPTERPQRERHAKLQRGETVDINTADTTELKRIPGIGSYFARRIVEMRQRRQAFSSPSELLTIRNFPESAIAYMTASQHFPVLHVNHATQQSLRSHPLINHTQAADIIAYRRTNGNIKSVKALSFLRSFTAEQLARLAPYLLFD